MNEPQNLQPSSPINWERLEAMIAAVNEQLKETSEQMKETDRRMQETDRMVKETSAQMKETDRMVKDTSAQMKETSAQMKETDRMVKETSAQMKETDRKIKELNSQFLSQSGHIVEGLMEPAALNLFKNAGFAIVGCWKEMKGTSAIDGRKMEIDLFYHDTTEAIAVEVKINCTKAKIDHFIEQMSHFKEVFTRYDDVKIYAAIAALNYDRGADQYAAEKGLFVIRVSDNDVFTLDPANKQDKICF